MTSDEHIKDEHDWVAHHLTDYLTDRADATVAARLHRHLAGCASCALDLESERRLQNHIRTPATIEYTPGASLAKLKARLAHAEAADAPKPRGWRSRRLAVPLSLAASLAALAISLFSLTARPPSIDEAQFQTLSRAPQARGELHVGFSDAATSREIERILAAVNGRIVSGPSAAGVYRVAVGKVFPVSEAIQVLAREQAVRFVAPAPEAADE